MRKLAIIVVFTLLAGCGGAGAETTTTTQAADAVSSTVASATATSTTRAPETNTTAGAETVADGPIAPDFQLELADGSTFALSAAEKPVYVVFWAEW